MVYLKNHDHPFKQERKETGRSNMRLLLFLSLFSLFLSCSSLGGSSYTERLNRSKQDRISSLMADLSPREGKLFFFSAVTREQYRDRELESCRQEAAAQLSRYNAINGVSYVQTENRNNNTKFWEAGDIAYNSDLASSLEESLVLEEKIQTEEGTCALFSYTPDQIPDFIFTASRDISKQPDWTLQALKLKGFQSAVGFTGPRRYLERTIQQADKNALATLLEQRSGSLETTQRDWQTGRASWSGSIITTRASGTIRQAYIISRWQDKKGNMYSLVLCPLIDPGKWMTRP
ncbi:hypothetical protein [Oceanispirochaeta sp.]|uniref:hypothetical protein n=1 Tax=Oceanispirochaeta sp. TaxID=2035350 RepID=UPI00260DACC2|nr:hypothetical protein [Oceanispirochaeta sp.]MDA3958141.1 hypothetical protein [Oceanispirochaeta sp.]